ncbi:type II secretion system protein M [Pseudomonas sp. CAU 1711]|uniref:type II secretion system protein M n=1 Tax=Pseudomonas sp. CAU 1711 TaxID=3140356 RepID=UPI0032611397
MSEWLSQWRARWAQGALAVRWQGLAQRDRLALALLGGFFALVLLYLLLWQPVSQRQARAGAYLQQQKALQAYMLQQAPQLRERQARPRASLDPSALQGLVTASAASQGLTIERLDSQGDGALQISLQPTEFARLLRWLVSLDEQGVSIDEAGLERADKGKVSSRLVLRAG